MDIIVNTELPAHETEDLDWLYVLLSDDASIQIYWTRKAEQLKFDIAIYPSWPLLNKDLKSGTFSEKTKFLVDEEYLGPAATSEAITLIASVMPSSVRYIVANLASEVAYEALNRGQVHAVVPATGAGAKVAVVNGHSQNA